LVLSQNAIAKVAASRRKIDADVWHLFTEGSPLEVVLPDCTAVNEAAMLKGIKDACTFRCFTFAFFSIPFFLFPSP
jgi:hypothetical protein